MNWINEIRHDISALQSTPKDLKKFGLTIGGLLVVLCTVAYVKGWWSTSTILMEGMLGVVLTIIALVFPQWLRGIYRWWMGFAIIIGSIVARIILFIVFFSIVSIISLGARIVGKKFYITHHDQKLSSYWIHRDQNKPINYERMS